jgi:phosphopantothenoylcysteine decarboxylase / phosphopantothenate---cysteine ligase
LIAGPVDLPTPFGVERINVRTAADMFSAVQQHADDDVVIMAAAVADFTPVAPAAGKIKKDSVGDEMQITLGRTQDILSWLGSQKREGQTIVGFALEHENVIEYAEKKLRTKNADMIVANQAGVSRSGFGGSDNTITIISRDGTPAPYPPMSKRACAEVILDHILDLRKENA